MVDYGWIGKLLELGRVDDGLDTWNAYIITTHPPHTHNRLTAFCPGLPG